MWPRTGKLFVEYNSRQNTSNIRDVGIVETGILGQSNTGSGFYPFTSLNFTDATDCPAIALKDLDFRVYWNEGGRFLDDSEYASLPAGGFSVLIPGFNASNGDYHFYVSTVASTTTNLSIEPVTLSEAKDQLRVDFTDDDTIITRLITRCRRAIENYCNVSMVSKQVTLTVDLLSALELPYGPVVGNIVSIIDCEGNVIDPTFYKILGTNFKSIQPLLRPFYDATIVYNVGYAIVEGDLKLAVLNEIAFRYENRGETTQNRNNVNPGVCLDAITLADPYKRETWR